MLNRETYMSMLYGVKTIRQPFLHDLMLVQNNTTILEDRHADILGVCSYRISDNPHYQLLFQFEPPQVPSVNDLLKVMKEKSVSHIPNEPLSQLQARKRHAQATADLVALITNLAFMPQEKVKKINFNTGSGKELFVDNVFTKMHTLSKKDLMRKQMLVENKKKNINRELL